MGHLERMNRGSGIKDRDDRSSGIEIIMSDTFTKINPTDPLILDKMASREKETKLIRFLRVVHESEQMLHGDHATKVND